MKKLQFKELSEYIQNIKHYELKNFQSESSLINFSWGVMMLLAGIADFNVAIFARWSAHFFIWATFVLFGFILQKFISTQPLSPLINQGDDLQRPGINILDVIFTLLMFVGATFIAFYDFRLILPYISLLMALSGLYFGYKRSKIINLGNKGFGGQYTYKVDTLYFIFITVILTILGLFSQNTQIFQGLVLGIAAGGRAMYYALKGRSALIQDYQMDGDDEEII